MVKKMRKNIKKLRIFFGFCGAAVRKKKARAKQRESKIYSIYFGSEEKQLVQKLYIYKKLVI